MSSFQCKKVEFSKQGIYLSGIHLPGVDLLTSLTPLDPPDEAGLMLPWRYRWVVRGVTGVEPIVDTDGRARRSFIGCCRVWSKHNQSHSLSTTLLITWAQVSITYIYFPVFTLTKTVWRPEIQDTSDLVVDSNPKTNRPIMTYFKVIKLTRFWWPLLAKWWNMKTNFSFPHTDFKIWFKYENSLSHHSSVNVLMPSA